jgi:hypothetical protein
MNRLNYALVIWTLALAAKAVRAHDSAEQRPADLEELARRRPELSDARVCDRALKKSLRPIHEGLRIRKDDAITRAAFEMSELHQKCLEAEGAAEETTLRETLDDMRELALSVRK